MSAAHYTAENKIVTLMKNVRALQCGDELCVSSADISRFTERAALIHPYMITVVMLTRQRRLFRRCRLISFLKVLHDMRFNIRVVQDSFDLMMHCRESTILL